jgi:HAD superfamily hydrolase (TIGR01509 family)
MDENIAKNPPVKAVIFDINGVVVQTRLDRLYKFVLQGPAILADKARKNSGLPERQTRLYAETRRLDRAVLEIAEDLRLAGYLTPALSNAGEPDIKAARDLGAYAGFDPVVLSGEVGMEKPDVRIFELAAAKIGMRPQECVFVDDNPEYVKAAAGMGFYGVVFKNAKQLRKILEGLGIKM